MKKIVFLYLCLVLFCLLISTGAVWASPFNFKITDSSGEEKAIFGFNEIPWLDVGLKDKDCKILGWWKPLPGCEKSVIFETNLTGGENIRRPLSDWGWGQPQDLSKYSIHLNGYGTRHITVTPEPLSSILFLIGGVSLAAARLRRRKK